MSALGTFPAFAPFGAPAILRPSGRFPVRMSFCSHRWRGEPWFDPYYGSLSDAGERRDLLQFKASGGCTGAVTVQRYNYPALASQRKLKGRPEGMSFGEWRGLVEEIIDGLGHPWIYLIGDLPAAAVYDGRLRRACEEMRDYVDHAYYFHEWETSRTGEGWTTKENCDGILLMREVLGDKAILGLHARPGGDVDGRMTGSSWPVEDDDPSHGDEASFFHNNAGGREVDVWAWQARHGHLGPSHTLQPFTADGRHETWLARLIEGVERFAPQGTINFYGDPVRTKILPAPPAEGPGDRIAPYWFAPPRARGPVELVCMEDVPFEYSRDEVSDDWVAEKDIVVAKTGLQSWGCMGIREES